MCICSLEIAFAWTVLIDFYGYCSAWVYALKVHSQVWKIVCQLKILHFLDFLVMQKNGLIRKIRLISKFMTSQPGNQSNAIHTLPNISRSKDNQKMKLGLLIEHHRNIFLEKSYTYCAAEAISRPFSTKSKLKISLDQHPEFLFILFYLSLCSKSMNTKIYWN